MSDLFNAAAPQGRVPLAAALRPDSLDQVVGQGGVIGPGSLLRRRIAADALGSVILYGPPGTGKTTIARAIGKMLGKTFCPLQAPNAKVADIRRLVDEAKVRPLLIFVDEIHRFSATQLDDLLALTENGSADFIAATTGNPYHTLTPALVSRSTICQLEPITIDEMAELIGRGVAHLAAGSEEIEISDAQIRMIAARSGGDARRALTALESLAVGHDHFPAKITQAMLDEVFAAAPIHSDRSGDQHYDVTSAFVKSMRGSDPDATLYWLARMIHGGEDPRYIARRIMIHASEDVGLADNSALQTAVAALHAVEKIGYPEAQIILAHAALHVARAPKSNAACRGIGLALSAVKSEAQVAVPMHLRDGHYAGAEALGHTGYRFPHNDPRGWVEQDYLGGIASGSFYQSDARAAASFEKRADAYWEGITGRPVAKTFPPDRAD